MEDPSYEFNLVQRLEWDRVELRLAPEYMGSSEFGSGAVVAAYEWLHSGNALAMFSTDITLDGVTKTVHFLGEPPTIEAKVAAMQEWLDQGARGQERSYFPERFNGVDWRGESIDLRRYRTVVWWSLDDDLIWSLQKEWLIRFLDQKGLRAAPLASL